MAKKELLTDFWVYELLKEANINLHPEGSIIKEIDDALKSASKAGTVEPIVHTHIKKGANVYTDEWHAYNNLGENYNNSRVNHGAKEYVNMMAGTNSIECFWYT